MIPAGQIWRLGPAGPGIVVSGPIGASSTPVERIGLVGAAAGDPVRVSGRLYRGVVEVLRDTGGVTIVNRLGMEAYLQGVVSAEMGRRSAAEREALRAQAVVSRTYAHRNLRRWAARGFDLYASVSDQVYGGLLAETPEGIEAVGSTRGRILSYGGTPIDAFFYSTCGGRTAEGTEVFRAANRPYLRSIADVGNDGLAYCVISPRYRWREEWSGATLLATLRRTLPEVTGTPGGGSHVRHRRADRLPNGIGSGRRAERRTSRDDRSGSTVPACAPRCGHPRASCSAAAPSTSAPRAPAIRSRGWLPRGEERATASASASGGRWAGRARGTTSSGSSPPTIRAPRSSGATDEGGAMTASRTTGERIRVGIIGGGAITQVAHLPVLRKLKTIEVRAICDTDLPKAKALADRFAVKDAFDDIEELLRYEELDAVVICSPNHLHESHILAALSANLHVLVEKPLAMTATSATRILRAAEKHGRVVMVGMNHRYRPDVQIVRSFVQSGELGTCRKRAWKLARLPPRSGAARLAPAAGSGRGRCHARPGTLDPRPRPLAGRQPRRRSA